MSEDIKKQIKETLETYNKYAEIYAKYLESKLLQFPLYQFTSYLPKSGKILDVGCGAGRDVEYLTEDGFDVVGIDIADKLLEQAKAKNLNVKKMDVLKLDFDPEYFDGIWCMATLSDIPKKDSKKVVKNLNTVLKKSGVLYIAVKEGDGEQIIKKEKYENSPRFYAFYKQNELESLLKESGFDILRSSIIKDDKNNWIEVYSRKK